MSHFSSKSKTSRGHSSQNQSDPFFQAKLAVGQPGDQYEQEADAMADKVVQEKSQEENVQSKTDENIQAQSLAKGVTPLVQLKVNRTVFQEKQKRKGSYQSSLRIVKRKLLYK